MSLLTLASISFLALAVGIGRASISEAGTVPDCPSSALTMEVGFTQAAAGNVGFPVVITNHGSTACALFGFPTIVAHTEAPSPHRVEFVHFARSQIYRTAKAQRVIVPPKGTASFGVSFADVLDQRYGQGSRCMMNSITVHLPGAAPVRGALLSFATFAQRGDGYGGPVNSCFAGFKFGLTPIVTGSAPPHH